MLALKAPPAKHRRGVDDIANAGCFDGRYTAVGIKIHGQYSNWIVAYCRFFYRCMVPSVIIIAVPSWTFLWDIFTSGVCKF